jgi:hypothetical protein
VLDWLFEHVYVRETEPAPPEWITAKHLYRINQRLIETAGMSPVLAKLIQAPSILLNGQQLRNLPELLLEIARRPALVEALAPSSLRMVHGDLHFQNILVGPLEDGLPFLLADPRGESRGSDLYYDIGKLWHSFNGLYDFLHTDQFSLEITPRGDSIQALLEMENNRALRTYHEIRDGMPALLRKYEVVRNDPHWRLKTMFSEAAHFSSVMPFHLGSDHQRAAAMYITGVKLLNDFAEEFDLDQWPEDRTYFNVNTYADYQRMLSSSVVVEELFC